MVYSVSQTVNLLPLLAYQKIYYDFFSDSQWEKHLAYSYNVDYWDGKSQLNLAPEMCQLRYANYPKDYFMGILPNSQYGSVAVMPSSYLYSDVPSSIVNPSTPSAGRLISGDTTVVEMSGNNSKRGQYLSLNSDLSALLYRDWETDRKSTRLNSSHITRSRMPSSA